MLTGSSREGGTLPQIAVPYRSLRTTGRLAEDQTGTCRDHNCQQQLMQSKAHMRLMLGSDPLPAQASGTVPDRRFESATLLRHGQADRQIEHADGPCHYHRNEA